MSENNITGTYSRKIQRNSDVRQFGRTITLNCDSTVIATFQGDMMNEKVKGYWSVKKGTLKVVIEEPLGHWPKENLFLIKRKKLINLATEINGKKITDERLKKALNKHNEKYAYGKTKNQSCK